MIKVRELGKNKFEVSVANTATTTHTVSIDPGYCEQLTGGGDSGNLVEKSFDFLLEREPNTSILSSFNLKVIQRYFPEYESEIRKQFQ